jgi:ABC-type antimicrobial peptide transport system permease subunit
MIFGRIKKQQSALAVSLLGSLAFIGLAIWGWNLPIETALSFVLISAILMMLVMMAAFVTAWLMSKYRNRR